MSEPTVTPLDPAKRKSKTFSKQLSKSFQKGKEAMKRGLLTPRGARAQEKPPAEALGGKAIAAPPSVPKAPLPTTDPVGKVKDVDATSKPLNARSEYVKATVEAKQDSPATVVLEPVDDVPSPELTGPATPAAKPSDKAVPDAVHPVTVMQPEVTAVAKKKEPAIEEESAPGEELGLEPPNVRVTVAGVLADEPKAVVALETTKAVPNVKLPEKKICGGAKKAVVGVLLLAAASVVGFAVKGAQSH